jgi:hypothetical protein
MTRDDYRPCPVDGCEARILPGLLMCRAHWYRVPRPLRAEVNEAWAAFRRVRRHNPHLVAAFARYNLVAAAAIAAAEPEREEMHP